MWSRTCKQLCFAVRRTTTMGEKSHVVYRGEDGRLISKEQAAQLPKKDYTREHMPNPGRGDTKKGK